MKINIRNIAKDFKQKFSLLNSRISFSQEGEDLLMERFLFSTSGPYIGTYVDVGAHHPSRFSNTYRLYKQGWSGVCIDPRPGLERQFAKVRPRDKFFPCGIDTTSGKIPFFEFDEAAFSTFSFDEASRKSLSERVQFVEKSIPVMTLFEVLSRAFPNGKVIDFMSIDVEGWERRVLESNDWSQFRPKYILVEALGHRMVDLTDSALGKFMLNNGYVGVAKTFNSYLFLENEACPI